MMISRWASTNFEKNHETSFETFWTAVFGETQFVPLHHMPYLADTLDLCYIFLFPKLKIHLGCKTYGGQ